MVNAKKDVAAEPTQAQIDFDKIISNSAYTASAKDIGKAIVKTLTTIGADSKITEIEAKIAAAATEGNRPLLKSLFAELTQTERDQENLKDKYKAIRGQDKFETVIQAWGPEVLDLALKIAAEVIKTASAAQHNANAGSDKGSTGKSATAKADAVKTPPKTYIVTQEITGKTAELPLRRGNAKPSKDKEVFELLGFKFNENDELTEAGFTYKDKDGKEVVEKEVSRKALLTALQNGGFAGFSVAVKG